MGGQPDNITQTNKVELSPEQQKIMGFAMPKIEEYASSTPQQYADSGVADFSPNEVAGQQALLDAIPGLQQTSSAGSAAQNLLLDPGFMLNPNQYLAPAADAVRRQATTALTEDVLPKIASGAKVSGGQYSGGATRQGVAEGVATGKTTQGISDAVAKMYLDNYTKGLSTMSDAVKNNSNVLQQALLPGQVQSSVGAQQRSMEQAKLNEVIQKFYTGQDIPLLQAKQIMGLVGTMPGAVGTSTVSPGGSSAGIGQQVAGLGMALLGNALMPGIGTALGAGMGK